jgi:chaperonin GroES
MFQKLRPLGDRVLVKRVENETKTESGLYIPDSAQEKAQTGSVIAIGEGRLNNDGTRTPLQVAVGDTVYVGKYAGTEAGKDYLIVREEEILGVVEEKSVVTL